MPNMSPGALPAWAKLFPCQSKLSKNVELLNVYALRKAYIERRELPQGSRSPLPQSTIFRKTDEAVPNTEIQRNPHRMRKGSSFGKSSYENGALLLKLSREASSGSDDIEEPTPIKDLENGSIPTLARPRPSYDPGISKFLPNLNYL